MLLKQPRVRHKGVIFGFVHLTQQTPLQQFTQLKPTELQEDQELVMWYSLLVSPNS